MRLAKAWPDGPLVFGRDDQISEFVARRIKHMHGEPFGPCVAIGIVRHNKLIGGVVFHEHQQNYKSVMVSYAFDRPDWVTRDVITSMCAYAFLQLGCNRVNTLTPRKNKRSRKFVEGIGFKLEGCARKAYGDDDAMIYGMLRRECRWLGENNGKA